ncbi:hypothetical protein [Sphingomonas parapaucimobilis]|uniref:Uncharacterized protein n=1 Tax=Sphingomonas parapaucimobilis NBRC 15100 TaxID=1219049 RepID=A0A0A1W8C8_9SPHN|nr:hypothetical protein [Sphingomonas parapaucimobilis]GAM01583.1 hypothetical protein SP5_066_00180 [Sphingomonas parapaucimobilis NBRC 15100]
MMIIQFATFSFAKFGKLIIEQLRGGDPVLQKAYVRLVIDTVRVDNHAIGIQCSKAALESAVVWDSDAAISMVPGFDRKWCPTGDKTGHSDHWKISISRR